MLCTQLSKCFYSIIEQPLGIGPRLASSDLVKVDSHFSEKPSFDFQRCCSSLHSHHTRLPHLALIQREELNSTSTTYAMPCWHSWEAHSVLNRNRGGMDRVQSWSVARWLYKRKKGRLWSAGKTKWKKNKNIFAL